MYQVIQLHKKCYKVILDIFQIEMRRANDISLFLGFQSELTTKSIVRLKRKEYYDQNNLNLNIK